MSDEPRFLKAVSAIEAAYNELGYDLGWRFLYSPRRTLSASSSLMLVGLNPGGDSYVPPKPSVEGGNAFRTEPDWSADGKRLQEEVRLMFRRLATAMRQPDEWPVIMDRALVANFCPFRSSRWNDLPRQEEAIAFSIHLWKQMFTEAGVRPAVIISNGKKAVPFFRQVLLNLGFEQLQVYEGPTGWGSYTYSVDVLGDSRGEILIAGLPHLSTFKLFSSSKCTQTTQGLLETIAARLQGKPDPTRSKLSQPHSVPVFKSPARLSSPAARPATRPAAAKASVSLEDAVGIAEELVSLLEERGHHASTRISKRVSIVVAGQPRQVIGIVPEKRPRLSCPWFDQDMTPPGAVFEHWRGYNRIILDGSSFEQVRDLCIEGLRRGGLL